MKNNLKSTAKVRIVDIISEGEIEGLVDGARSIYLDDTPVMDGGVSNFNGVEVDWRNGTSDQPAVKGSTTVENGISVGVELKHGISWTRDFTNLDLTSVRVQLAVPQLFRVESDGGLDGFEVLYAIDVSADGGPFTEVIQSAFRGKTQSRYQRSHEIDLPAATSRRTIRVRRLTEQPTSSQISALTFIDSITEIIDGRFNYPHTAHVGIEFSSEHFQSTPRRAYHIRGIKVRVPSNYDPIGRTYSGVWNGQWKIAWTNNPAWVFLDLATHPRYGLGDRIPLDYMDKWALYDIARYCDQMVPDGFGGTEPRFTVNVQIMDREQAHDLLQKLTSVFQGMAYYASGIVTAVSDSPKDPVALYTNSDVEDGRFTYSGTPQSTRYTVALVGWQNHKDFGRQEIEYVEDQQGLIRYGLIETQMTAFGCSSRGQAHRAGKWALLTSQVETQTCTFRVGLKGLKARPGDVIQIMDQDLIGRMQGGLISSATGSSITVDNDPVAKSGDKVTVMMESGEAQIRTVSSVSGRRINVSQAFSGRPQVQGSWATEGDVRLQQYRVLGITESDDGTSFELKCLQYEPGKYDAIAYGTQFDPRPITSLPHGIQPPPTNVRWKQEVRVEQGVAKTRAILQWDAAKNAVSYEVEWRRNDGEWVRSPQTGGTSITLEDIHRGRYVGKVTAINASGIRSLPAYSQEQRLDGKDLPPPQVTHLTTTPLLWGIQLNWGFAAEGAADIERTEVWISPTPSLGDATKFTDIAYPQASFAHLGMMAGAEFWYWVRVVDRTGNYGYFFPDGEGVYGVTITEADQYLDAIRDEILTTNLAEQLINDRMDAEAEAILAQVDAMMSSAEEAIQQAIDDAASVSTSEAIAAAEAAVEDGMEYARGIIRDAVAGVERLVRESNELEQLTVNAERYIREDDTATTTQKVEVLEVEVNENLSAAVRDLTELVHTEDAILAQSVVDLEAKVNDNHAYAQDRLTTLANQDEAISQSITQLRSDVGDDIAATVQDLQQTVATAENALSQSISELEVRVNDDISGAISNLQQVVADQGSSLAQDISTLEARVTDDIGSTVENIQQALADQEQAFSEDISTLTSQVEDNQALANTRHATLTTKDEALASSIDNLSVEVWENQALAETRFNVLTNEDEALSSRIDTLNSTVEGNKAEVEQSVTALTTKDTALTNSLNSLTTQFNDNKAEVESKLSTLTSEDSALAQRIDTLTTTVGTNKSDADSRMQTLADADQAMALMVDTLTSTVADNKAEVEDHVEVLVLADDALGRRVDNLTTTVADNKAEVLSEITTRTGPTSALANSISALSATVDTNKSELESSLTALTGPNSAIVKNHNALKAVVGNSSSGLVRDVAAVTNTANTALSHSQTLRSDWNSFNNTTLKDRIRTYADGNSAVGKTVSNLTSRVGNAESTINTTASTLATTNGKLNSLYTIKTQVASNGRRYWAGIGLGVENEPGGKGFISQILLQANRVAVLNTNNDSVHSPFAVEGNQVFIRNAFIKDASITSAKIKDAAITNAKIKNAEIDSLKIKGNTATVPLGVFTRGNSSQLSSSWMTVATLSVPYIGESIQYLVTASCRLSAGSTPAIFEVRLLRSGYTQPLLQIENYTVTNGHRPVSVSVIDKFTNIGTITLELQARRLDSGGSAVVGYRTISAIGLRR